MKTLTTRREIMALTERGARDWINACETAQDEALESIAARILQSGVSLVALAGPSCSGKTTTAHHLIDLLAQSGKSVRVISTDDFFLDVDSYPETADGVPDFDHFDRLDSVLLADILRDVCAKKPVLLPSFDFVSGRRKKERIAYCPDRDSIIILEGIHALNDRLYSDKLSYFRLGLNVTESFSLDGRTLFSPRELRLIRRAVRDEKFRNYKAEQTLNIWKNVLRGETNFVLPYLDTTDAFLSTGLAYEPCVWRDDALRSFAPIPDESPFFGLAQDLIERLALVPSLATALVPKQSILREFIGPEPDKKEF